MKIEFITVRVNLKAGLDLHASIEAQLSLQGEPLRWAVTAVEYGTAIVEAVILLECDPAKQA